jgi:hypothetical protein
LMTPNQSWIPWPRCLATPTARRKNGGLNGNVIEIFMGDYPANINKPWLMTGGVYCFWPGWILARGYFALNHHLKSRRIG